MSVINVVFLIMAAGLFMRIFLFYNKKGKTFERVFPFLKNFLMIKFIVLF